MLLHRAGATPQRGTKRPLEVGPSFASAELHDFGSRANGSQLHLTPQSLVGGPPELQPLPSMLPSPTVHRTYPLPPAPTTHPSWPTGIVARATMPVATPMPPLQPQVNLEALFMQQSAMLKANVEKQATAQRALQTARHELGVLCAQIPALQHLCGEDDSKLDEVEQRVARCTAVLERGQHTGMALAVHRARLSAELELLEAAWAKHCTSSQQYRS
jgi:hypothetical protein